MAKYVMVFNSSGNPITMADSGRVIGAGDWDYVDSESDAGKDVLSMDGVIEQDYTKADQNSNSRVQQLADEIRKLNGDAPQEVPATKPGADAQDGSSSSDAAATVSTKSASTKATAKGKG